MPRYKKGDRVRSTVETRFVLKGATGTVAKTTRVHYVSWDSENMLTEFGKNRHDWLKEKCLWIAVNNLELIPSDHSSESGKTFEPKFIKGDWVVINSEELPIGAIGIVQGHYTVGRKYHIKLLDGTEVVCVEEELQKSNLTNREKFLITVPLAGPKPDTEEWWRWHFAGIAMQGILANSEISANHQALNIEKTAIIFSDALIAELKKKGGAQ